MELGHFTERVNGVNIHYVAQGEGEPVLLLHGWPEFWYSWRNQLPVLGGSYRAIAPDMRGFGYSDKPLSGYDTRTAAAIRERWHSYFHQQFDLPEKIEGRERSTCVIFSGTGASTSIRSAMMVPQVEPRLPVPQRGHPVLQGVSGARMILPRVGRINQSRSARPALGVGGCRLILTAGYLPFIRRLWRTRSCCLNRLPPPALPCCIR